MASALGLRIWLAVMLAGAGLAPVASAAVPAAPSYCSAVALSATASNATIQISWQDNSTDETRWYIEYSINNGSSYVTSLSYVPSSSTLTSGTTLAYSWAGAALNTKYLIRVKAYNASGKSAASNVATVGTLALGTPLNFSVTQVDPFNVSMNWADNSTGETSFSIERKSGTTGVWEAFSMGANAVAISPSNLIFPLGSFSFRIRAGNATTATFSAYSSEVPVTAAAYSLTASKVAGQPTVNLTWPDLPAEDGYQIVYKGAADASYFILGQVAANVTTYQVTAPAIWPDETYQFAVLPFKGSSATGVLGWSSTPSVTLDPYPLTATAVPCQLLVDLSWADLQNEDSYQIWYKVAGAPSYALLTTVEANVTTYQVTIPELDSAMVVSFIVAPYQGTELLTQSSMATVTVNATLAMTSKPGASGTPGSAFAHTFTHVGGGAVSSRTLTGDNTGLTFNNNTGELTGIYPTLGNYTLHYTLHDTSGCALTQTFSIRVRPADGAPLVATAIPAWTGTPGSNRDTALAGAFTDPEAESAVRVSTTLGTMDFILFDTATPATVANFMSYVNAEAYTDVMFHRCILGFMNQTGGFKGTGSGNQFTGVVTHAPVMNEPGIPNMRGTLSMAKSNNPDSATCQFFVSVSNNNEDPYPLGLDYQNGGFTVFGRVAGNGMAVADAINNLPVGNYTSPPADLTVDGSSAGSIFASCPMNALSAPATMEQDKLVKINSVTAIPTLSYSITGNSNPAVAQATIVDGQVHLLGLQGGLTTVTVTATDLDNHSTSQSVAVSLSDTYDTWKARNTFTGGQGAASQDPDADGWDNLLEYAFLGAPSLANNTSQTVAAGTTGVAPDPQYLTLTFPVRKATTGLAYVVEGNDGLSGTWSEVWNSTTPSSPTAVSELDLTDRTVWTIRDTVALGVRPKRFMRIRIVQQ